MIFVLAVDVLCACLFGRISALVYDVFYGYNREGYFLNFAEITMFVFR